MCELKRLLKIEEGINREDLLYKTCDIKKIRCATMQSFGSISAVSNGATTLEYAVNDQKYLKDIIRNFN